MQFKGINNNKEEETKSQSAAIYTLIDNYAADAAPKQQRLNSRGVYNVRINSVNQN